MSEVLRRAQDEALEVLAGPAPYALSWQEQHARVVEMEGVVIRLLIASGVPKDRIRIMLGGQLMEVQG